jgi:hypothetical protein
MTKPSTVQRLLSADSNVLAGEQPDALAVRQPTVDMAVLKSFIGLDSVLLLGTELHGVGRRTAGKWMR